MMHGKIAYIIYSNFYTNQPIMMKIAKNAFKSMGMTAKNNIVLHNVYVLFFLLFLAVLNLVYFSQINDYISVVLFFLVGLLTSFFSKNMVVILFISIVITNIYAYGVNGVPLSNTSEGFLNIGSGMPKDKQNGSGSGSGSEHVKVSGSGSGSGVSSGATNKTNLADVLGSGFNQGSDEEIIDKILNTQQKLIAQMGVLEPTLVKAEQFLEKFQSTMGGANTK